MKERINKLKTFVVALTLLAAFSCAGLDDDMDSPSVNTTADVTSMQESIRWANAIVTVRTASSGRSYFQLSDDSTLDPLGWQNPFSKEVRALVAYSELTDKSDFCTRSVKVERIDSIVTRDHLLGRGNPAYGQPLCPAGPSGPSLHCPQGQRRPSEHLEGRIGSIQDMPSVSVQEGRIQQSGINRPPLDVIQWGEISCIEVR